MFEDIEKEIQNETLFIKDQKKKVVHFYEKYTKDLTEREVYRYYRRIMREREQDLIRNYEEEKDELSERLLGEENLGSP